MRAPETGGHGGIVELEGVRARGGGGGGRPRPPAAARDGRARTGSAGAALAPGGGDTDARGHHPAVRPPARRRLLAPSRSRRRPRWRWWLRRWGRGRRRRAPERQRPGARHVRRGRPDVSVTAATFVVGLALVALAALAWIWLWADRDTSRPVIVEHLPALADCGMVALWIHALALAAGGGGTLKAYLITGVLACAAGVLRNPPGARDEEAEPEIVVVAAPDRDVP